MKFFAGLIVGVILGYVFFVLLYIPDYVDDDSSPVPEVESVRGVDDLGNA